MLNTRTPRVRRSAGSMASNTTSCKFSPPASPSKAPSSTPSNKRKRSMSATSQAVQRNVKQKTETALRKSNVQPPYTASKEDFDVEVIERVEQEIDHADPEPTSPVASCPLTPGGFDDNDTDLDSLFNSEASNKDSISGIQSDKDTPAIVSPTIVSTPMSSVNTEPAPPNEDKKRKASEDITSSADESSSAKKMKKMVTEPEKDTIVDLLFNGTHMPSNTEAPIRPRKKLRRAAKLANPMRTDVRMGVSGSAAAGTGSRATRQPTSRKPLAKAPKLITPPTSEEERSPDEIAALATLKGKQARLAAEKKHTVLIESLEEVNLPKGMQDGLIRADKNVKKDRNAGGFKPKPSWRQDNEELNEVDELIDNVMRRKNFGFGKTMAMPEGAKRLNKIKSGAFNVGRFNDPRTAYKRKLEADEARAEENAKKRMMVAKMQAAEEEELDDGGLDELFLES